MYLLLGAGIENKILHYITIPGWQVSVSLLFLRLCASNIPCYTDSPQKQKQNTIPILIFARHCLWSVHRHRLNFQGVRLRLFMKPKSHHLRMNQDSLQLSISLLSAVLNNGMCLGVHFSLANKHTGVCWLLVLKNSSKISCCFYISAVFTALNFSVCLVCNL